MAITTTYKAIADLDTGAARMNIVQPLATYDNSAHVFAVEIRRGSSAEELSGATCIGYFVRADGVTIPIDGETKGNVATVILAANCYAVAGGFALAVKLSMGNVVHTVLRATGNVSVSQTDEMASPGTGVQSFDKLVKAAEKAEGYDARITETEKTVDTLVEQTQKIPLSIQVNLSSTKPSALDGTDNLKPGRTGVLSIDGGGTGATSKEEARINIGAASVEEVRQRDRVKNLLDNSWFVNPINQRGQTTYTGSRYSIDRWRTWSNDATITLTSEGIKGDGTDASVLYQDIELHKIKLGTAYTVAVGYSDGTISCDARTLTTSSSAGIWNNEAQACLSWGDGSPFMRLWHATKTIQWAAIYPGAYTAETLPAYVYKGYAAELAECQRYYYRIKAYWKWLSAGLCTNATTAIIPIHLPTAMRVAPTVAMPDKALIKVRCGATPSQAPTAVTWEDTSTLHDYVQLTATVSGATNGDIAMLYFDNGGVIEFSADL